MAICNFVGAERALCNKLFNDMSDRLRNRIDLFICEEAINIFEGNKHQFITFERWCDKLSLEITSLVKSKSPKGWISKHTVEVQIELICYLDDIFGFSPDESYYLVRNFFMEKLYILFEASAKDSRNLFYKSVNKTFAKLPNNF